jgi:uncharacterized protein (DUF302 family)
MWNHFGIMAALAFVALLPCSVRAQPVERQLESKMSKTAASDDGLVTLPSAHAHAETIARLKSVLTKKGIKLFASIDHAAEAKQAGLALPPTQVLIFGNPKAGTPLMQSKQTIGLDLPLRVLIWEDKDGKVWLTFTRLAVLAQRHQIADRDETVEALDAGLAALARAATGP